MYPLFWKVMKCLHTGYMYCVVNNFGMHLTKQKQSKSVNCGHLFVLIRLFN